MFDQATRLRELAAAFRAKAGGSRVRTTKVIAVTSGKGGVGKTNLSVNLAQGLVAAGKEVILFDVDLGLANADILLGTVPPFHLGHLLTGEREILDLIHQTPNGIKLIAGGSGLAELANLSEDRLQTFVGAMARLDGQADYLILDTGAGLGIGVQRFVLAADEVLIVSTPEPTAMADAYAMIKALAGANPALNMKLIINQAEPGAEAEGVAQRLILMAQGFLGHELEHLGTVPRDPAVWQAVRQQIPFVVGHPDSPASKAVTLLVKRLLGDLPPEQVTLPKRSGFFDRLSRLFRDSNAV
jgi:flagellar biosynthesis protein FlhG